MASDDWTTQNTPSGSNNINEGSLEAMDSFSIHDHNDSDSDSVSDMTSSEDGDLDDYPLNERLQIPTEYFKRLDSLESQVLENSMIQFYTEGANPTVHAPSDYNFHLKVGHGRSTSCRKLKETDITKFYEEVLELANNAVFQEASLFASPHQANAATNRFGHAIETMFHFIECRNIMLFVAHSVEAMQKASYCADFLSILVLDKTEHNIARLLPIQCHKIKQLATAFENSLSQVIDKDPSTTLFNPAIECPEVSEGCRELLLELGLGDLAGTQIDLWRCAVHVLDIAVLSYAGAHTRYFSTTNLRSFTIPGPFLEKQHFTFRRRSFLCLDDFLGGKEACVLEWYHPEMAQPYLPALYLSTDATTFADIWGPMWKTCALQDGQAQSDHILHYNVGNGVILPWSLPSSESQTSISCRKGEVFCHWMSDKNIGEIGDLVGSSGVPLQPRDILLIGAMNKLQYNTECTVSTSAVKQQLRKTNSLFEFGTMKSTRVLESESVQVQVGPSYVKGSLQRSYKRRGITWKEAWTEDWKNSPESRNVRILEYKFGIEVSACTYNARRRRLISLLSSETMMNYLRNAALTWESLECEKSFYAAISSSDYKAFRKLYLSRKDWQFDLGKAITHCLDALTRTGTNEAGLDLHWVPDSDPGHKVNLKLHDHSWIGFLKDTETCCTMAILENKCLEFRHPTHGKGCQRQEGGLESTINSLSKQGLNRSVLETSFMLHQDAVPKPMAPKSCRRHNGSISKHVHVWSTSSLKVGERFHFGDNGCLKYINSLGNGQILAEWRSSRLKGFHGESNHWEYIRVEKGAPGPVYVLIMSSETSKITSLFAAPEKLPLRTRHYSWVSSKIARPRTTGDSRIDKMRYTIHDWIRGESSSVDMHSFDGWESIVDIVASLPGSERRSSDGDGARELETNQMNRRSRDM